MSLASSEVASEASALESSEVAREAERQLAASMVLFGAFHPDWRTLRGATTV